MAERIITVEQTGREIVAPSVHLNGSSRDTLRDGYAQAHTAVEAAIREVERVEVNARDYYVQGDAVFTRARREHVERLSALQRVADELLALFFSVDS